LRNYNEGENQNKKRKFRFFNLNKDGKGVYENEDRTPNLKFFFKLLWRKFSAILQLNLLMLIHIIPIVALVFVFFMGEKTPTITNTAFPALYGINFIGMTGGAPILDISSISMGIPVFSPVTNIIIICVAVVWIATFGWQCVGSAYVLRGLFRGDPVFVFSDYFYGIKRNLKQGLIMGLIDVLVIGVLLVDLSFFASNGGFMYYVIIAIMFLYLIMRFYTYLMLITFELKTIKIIKNALIFTALGIKRNLMAVLGIAVLMALNFFLVIWLVPSGIALPLLLPLLYLMGTLSFITTYAAYPVIDKYMIAPYVKENKEENNQDEEITE